MLLQEEDLWGLLERGDLGSNNLLFGRILAQPSDVEGGDCEGPIRHELGELGRSNACHRLLMLVVVRARGVPFEEQAVSRDRCPYFIVQVRDGLDVLPMEMLSGGVWE
ncbi:unnamed protein product [Sphagnum tenellum]